MTSRKKINSFVGGGVYTLPQAARLLCVHHNTLRYWSGYASQPSLIEREFKDELILTFSELMEFHFIKLFRDKNVSLQTIRRAGREARRRFKTDRPFSVKRFDTDGKSIFATLTSNETDQEVVEELRHGQLVFQKIIRPFFRRLEYTQGLKRFWPLFKKGRVVLDPKRSFGHPIDAETGIPVETIIDALKAGDGQDAKAVAKWFDIPLEAVMAAKKYDGSLVA